MSRLLYAFSAVALLTGGALLHRALRGQDHSSRAPAALACSLSPSLAISRTEPATVPVLLRAPPGAQVFVDDALIAARDLGSVRLLPGEHTVRVEAEGEAALWTRLAVLPFTPVLVYAALDGDAGLTAIRLGARCARCERAAGEVHINPRSSGEDGSWGLVEAARALRSDDWSSAKDALERVPARKRATTLYVRLQAGVRWAAGDERGAHRDVAAAAKAESALRSYLASFEAASKAERVAQRQAQLRRWNAVTERLGVLLQRFESLASGPLTVASARLEELGKVLEEKGRSDELDIEELVAAGEGVLETLIAQLRGSKPTDCAFQTELATALTLVPPL